MTLRPRGDFEEFKFSSPAISEFGIGAVSVWTRGGDAVQASGVEVIGSNHETVRYRATTVLDVGGYELRFTVGQSVEPERLEPQFHPTGRANEWSVRFFVGSRFCIVSAGLCPEANTKKMALFVKFSDSVSPLAGSILNTAVRLSYDGNSSACVPATGDATVTNPELHFVCNMPSRTTGSAEISFESPPLSGSEGGSLQDCATGTELKRISLPYSETVCNTFKWQ